MEYVKFKDIKPADYNPRRISESAFHELKGSLKALGFVLPIIVNRDNMTIYCDKRALSLRRPYSLFRWILPLMVLGRASRNSTMRGYL